MVSSRGLSALFCAAVGLGCAASAFEERGGDEGAAVRVAAAAPRPTPPAPPTAAPPPAAPAAVDTDLPTGSIDLGPALHRPDPGAYAREPGAGDAPVLTGAEAVNYLAGNTLRRGGAGEPERASFFAERGLVGEGDGRGFVVRRWDRERPELCEPGPEGRPLCRAVRIVLDGRYEFPGARLGTVTLGAAGASGPVTAELVKGDALHLPDHVPFLDGGEGPEGTGASAGGLAGLAGRPLLAEAEGAGARGREVVVYGRDGRRLAFRQVQDGDGRAVEAAVGRWREGRDGLCQTRGAGAPQSCFRVEALAGGGLRLAPAGRGGEAQTLAPLPEAPRD